MLWPDEGWPLVTGCLGWVGCIQRNSYKVVLETWGLHPQVALTVT